MRWLADECVAARIVGHLRDGGEDVVYVAEFQPGATDTEIIRLANENRLLLTADKDFGDLVFKQALFVPGVVLLRVNPGRQALQW